MPAPAVYVLAVVGTVAAGLAFKEFVYEPHIAPKLERWAQEFISKRNARKRMREQAISVSLPFNNGHSSKRSDDGGDDDDKSVIELERLVSHVSQEVQEWRNEVDRSQSSTLRQRRNVSSPASRLDQSISIPVMQPTHVIFDTSTTPTSTIASRVPSPSPAPPRVVHLSGSHETLRSPPPGRLPTPDTSDHSSSPRLPPSLVSPVFIPSLSLSHPVDLDHEHGIELLSAPSSRPDTPFSSLSTADYHSFSPSVLSDDDVSLQSASTAPSVISDFDDLRSNFGSEISESSWASAGPRSP